MYLKPEILENIRNIPLKSVLIAAGARPDHYDKYRWHTSKGIISVTGLKYMNWSSGAAGRGAIDLAIHLTDLNFKGSLEWLSQRFPASVRIYRNPGKSTTKQALRLPVSSPGNISRVKKYLVRTRQIRLDLIEQIIKSGDLYADQLANAVFLQKTEHKKVTGAELRGTGHYPFQGLAPGSWKNHGFFSISDSVTDKYIICESAIDAISCLMINPGYCCISTAGARSNPLWLQPLILRSSIIHCGFDADPTGDAMAGEMIEMYPEIIRLRPKKKDWNDMLL